MKNSCGHKRYRVPINFITNLKTISKPLAINVEARLFPMQESMRPPHASDYVGKPRHSSKSHPSIWKTLINQQACQTFMRPWEQRGGHGLGLPLYSALQVIGELLCQDNSVCRELEQRTILSPSESRYRAGKETLDGIKGDMGDRKRSNFEGMRPVT